MTVKTFSQCQEAAGTKQMKGRYSGIVVICSNTGGTVKIMVVEDNDTVAQTIKAFLSVNGHSVLGPYSTSAEIFRAVQQGPPDLVLMDIYLHGRASGLDCARVIFQCHRIPVIFLTSDPAVTRTGEQVAFGALAKPVSGDTLLASLHVVDQMVQGRVPEYMPPSLTVFNCPGHH